MFRNKITLLFICIGIFPSSLKAQHYPIENENKSLKIQIGTDILPWMTGVPNINANVFIADEISIQAGLGLIPFTYFFHPQVTILSGIPYLETGISLGAYKKFQMDYHFFAPEDYCNYKASVYSSFEHWNYNYQSNFKVNRSKIKIGLSTIYNYKEKVNLTFHYGLMGGRDRCEYLNKSSASLSTPINRRGYIFSAGNAQTKTKLFWFLDFGMRISYDLY
jgi:hypothetical protein